MNAAERPAEDPSSPSFGRIPATYSNDTATDSAMKALENRPWFSIRMQIYLAVLLSLVMFIGIASALLVTTYMIEKKVHFLEISNSYLFEIQQARRFEKNYFLYATNLSDALENISTARKILTDNAGDLEEVMGIAAFSQTFPQLENYERSLRQLEQSGGRHVADEEFGTRSEAEAAARKHGHELVSFAEAFMQKEKIALDNMIVLSRKVHIYSFLFLFAFVTFSTYFLGRRVLLPLRRFVSYAERIASGDYSPVMPARRYRDEFSNLAMAINRMIKEIQSKQDQLIQAHKVSAIGLLTSGIAHELNNPINNVNITAEYILDNFESLPDEEKRQLLTDIMRQGERASSTVKELLHFTRVKVESFEEMQIAAVIEDTLKLLQNQLSLTGIRVEKQYPDDIPLIRGNRNNLQQVFLNLFLNAIHAMPGGGSLQISVSDTHVGLLRVDITDTGVGIKPEYLQKIFDPYFTTKQVGEGTGLGLTVCFGIIKKHGGQIHVASEVGKGSTFSLYLPCIPRQDTRSREGSPGSDEEPRATMTSS